MDFIPRNMQKLRETGESILARHLGFPRNPNHNRNLNPPEPIMIMSRIKITTAERAAVNPHLHFRLKLRLAQRLS
jgi:hypothetical protein